MKTISMPVNDRPEYLQRVLASIRDCHDHKDWVLVFSCEPGRCYEVAKTVDWMPTYINRNPVQMGLRVNTFLAANLAHKIGSTFNLYAEDDSVLSKDALRLMWQFDASGLPGVCCLRRWHETQDANQPAFVRPDHHGLLGCGFGYSRKHWLAHLARYWFYFDPKMGGDDWDWSVSWALDTLQIPQWRPLVNRSQNIGERGTNTSAGLDLNMFGACYTGAPVAQFEFV